MDQKQSELQPPALASKLLHGGRKLTAREARLLAAPYKGEPDETPPPKQG